MESGAVVLSDLGICCIDEFDKMSDMSGIVRRGHGAADYIIGQSWYCGHFECASVDLRGGQSVDSRYEPADCPVVENIQLPPTLLSRFDLDLY